MTIGPDYVPVFFNQQTLKQFPFDYSEVIKK